MSTGPSTAVRQEVLARDGSKCVSCGRFIWEVGSYSLHHRIPRGMGGTRNPEINLPANLIVLCGTGTTGCHGWVEKHRHKALEWGYLIRRDTTSPHKQPVFTADGWRRFDNEGGWAEAYPVNLSPERADELARDIKRGIDTRTGVVA